MSGEYQTSLSISGEYYFNIAANLTANETLEVSQPHYAVFGLGNKKKSRVMISELFWCGWDPNADRRDNLFSISYSEKASIF